MTIRNNEERLGAVPNDSTPMLNQVQQDPMSFVVPTLHVDLPSQGRYYKEDHPLHNQESVEIRLMTAKDEDILTSPSLIKKNLVLDRFIENILIDKRIKVDDLLVGDKNAIIIQSRMSGYGTDYTAALQCPSCEVSQEIEFDLEECYNLLEGGISEDCERLENGNILVKLPQTKCECEIKLLNGKDEKSLLKKTTGKKPNENLLTNQLKIMIVSVNGYDDQRVIDYFVDRMPVKDAKKLREVYITSNPSANLITEFVCENCDHKEDLEVPLTAEFFWPK